MMNPLFPLSTSQHPLIPLDPPTNLTVSSATAQVMRMLLENGIPPQLIAGLLETAGFRRAHVCYLRGPVILPTGAWTDNLPDWLTPAIYSDRLAVILSEYSAGIVGYLATPADVLAYLYPRTLDAPLPDDWQRLYRWAGQAVLPRHSQMWRADFLERVNGGLPVALTRYERARLRRLQYDLRRQVVSTAMANEPLPPALPAPALFPPSQQTLFEAVSP